MKTLPLSIRIVALIGACALVAGGCSTASPSVDAGNTPDVSEDVSVSPDVNQCEDPDDDGFGPGCAAGTDDCQPADPASYPGADERCGDGIDNDCDGSVDEGCPCVTGTSEACYTGPEGTDGVGACQSGVRTCAAGEWSECEGQSVPRGDEESTCDGVDNDCDGEVDEGLTNACGSCGALPVESCGDDGLTGDGLDNDCDGEIDEDCNCDGRTAQPCYSGRPATLGVGRCRGGVTDCEGESWGACVGELLPIEEVCDGLDNDCDGSADEGLRNACGVCGAPEPRELCDGVDNDCDGGVDEGLLLACGVCPGDAPEEECGDGLDNDCDGEVDESCSCFGVEPCYPGPADTLGVGQCAAGTRSCDAAGEFWSACADFVLPTIEVCDGVDNDCDGLVDIGPNGCTVCGTDPEVCDEIDNDCDGQIDEGVRNACGVCIEDAPPEAICDGEDDDCDGFIDEGLTNACGTCGDSCYVREWDDSGDWGTGDFDGIDDTNTEEGLRLGSARASFPDLWIANTADDTVMRINTDNATVVGTYDVGSDPSRTAVDFDGNMFVANRAFDEQGTVSRVLANGCTGNDCVAWTVDVGGVGDVPRGLAVDREGYAWVGTYFGRQLFRLAPDDGEIVATYNIPMNIYGIAIDSEGFLWIASISDQGLGKFDTNTGLFVEAYQVEDGECGHPYGVAVDAVGNVWAGAWQCDGLLRLNRAAGATHLQRIDHENLQATRGVAVDGEGAVYITASGTDRFGKYLPTTGEWAWTAETCSVPIGVGVASDGNLWVMCRDDNEARRYSPDGEELDVLTTGRQPYSYSDMTGFQLRNFTAPSGTWTVLFDCGYEGCGFDAIDFTSVEPAGTGVTVRARSRGASTDAEWSAWTPSFDVSPAPIQGLLPTGRFAEVEVTLSTTDRDITPLVTALSVDWQRP